jgi:hypothetical protein
MRKIEAPAPVIKKTVRTTTSNATAIANKP